MEDKMLTEKKMRQAIEMLRRQGGGTVNIMPPLEMAYANAKTPDVISPSCGTPDYTTIYFDPNTRTYRTSHQDREIQDIRKDKAKKDRDLDDLIAHYYMKG